MSENKSLQQDNNTVKHPNQKTLSAMTEAIEMANDPDAAAFSSVRELLKELDE